MKQLVLLSGMLEALAYILFILVELRGAISIPMEYKAISIPGDIIEGWHQVGENYHKFERSFIIRNNHPYDRYSSTKIFWPGEESPYTTNGRITFFKCFNRTPNNARALLHVIYGGVGTPELVVDILYTPLRFMIINTMIITCDIYYTEDSEFVGIEKPVLRNSLDTMKSTTEMASSTTDTTPGIIPAENSQRKIDAETRLPVGVESTSQTMIDLQTRGTSPKPRKRVTESIRTGDSTTWKTTKAIISGEKVSTVATTSPWIESTEFHNKDTSGRRDKTTTSGGKTDHGTETDLAAVQETGRKLNGTTLSTTPSSSNLSSEKSQHEGPVERIILDTKKTSPVTVRTTLAVTSPKFIESSSRKDETSTASWYEMILQNKNNESQHENGRNPNASSKDSKDGKIKKNTSSTGKTTLRTEKITLIEASPETPRELATTTPMMDKINSYSEDYSSSEDEKEVEFRCRLKSLRTKKTNSNINGTINDLKDQEARSLKEENTVTEPKPSSVYNLIVKMMPTGSRRKLGLAKITYR